MIFFSSFLDLIPKKEFLEAPEAIDRYTATK
jgi:hypothetical protein